MSISAAIRNLMGWREQHEGHGRLENEQHDEEEEPGAALQVSTASTDNDRMVPDPEETEDEEEEMDEVSLVGEEASVTTNNINTAEEEEMAEQSSSRAGQTVTLVELGEERELAQCRTSACLLLAVFVLFRLWIEAIANADSVLFLLCVVFTSWIVRYIRYNRVREEELDRRIAAYVRAEGSDGQVTEIPRSDVDMLSFQAQLVAMDIIEPQRQITQGGVRHPDGENNGDAGVSEEARQRWERFKHMSSDLPTLNENKSYRSVAQDDIEKGEEELPQCSICLCEYEDCENIVRLPCNHIYHEDCVTSWTSNHVRCPLCNFDLESNLAATPIPSISGESVV